jgi:hypothetical protein
MIGYFRKNMSKIPGDNGSSLRLVPSETQCLLENISLGQTDGTVRAQTVSDCFKLVAAFNTGYCMEYPFFARFLATPMCMVGIVIPRARHSAS